MGEDNRVDDIDDDSGASTATSDAASTDTSKIVKILIYVGGLVLLIFLVMGISYMVTVYYQNKVNQKERDIVIAPPPAPLAHFDLPSFAITTKDEEAHFAKITVSLGYEDSIELNTELVKRTVQIQHLINIVLSGKRYEDLDSIEDRISLSEEIKAHINVILISGKIKEVYYREFVVN